MYRTGTVGITRSLHWTMFDPNVYGTWTGLGGCHGGSIGGVAPT